MTWEGIKLRILLAGLGIGFGGLALCLAGWSAGRLGCRRSLVRFGWEFIGVAVWSRGFGALFLLSWLLAKHLYCLALSCLLWSIPNLRDSQSPFPRKYKDIAS